MNVATPSTSGKEKDNFDDDDISSVRTDLTTIPASNVRRVTLSPEERMNNQRESTPIQRSWQALLDKIPDPEDRAHFVHLIFSTMDHRSRSRRCLQPGYIRVIFLAEFPGYNGNRDELGALTEPITTGFNLEDTRSDTLRMVRDSDRHYAPLRERARDGQPPVAEAALTVASEASSSLSDSSNRRATANHDAFAQPPPDAVAPPPDIAPFSNSRAVNNLAALGGSDGSGNSALASGSQTTVGLHLSGSSTGEDVKPAAKEKHFDGKNPGRPGPGSGPGKPSDGGHPPGMGGAGAAAI